MSTTQTDVTDQVTFDDNDGESLPLTKCVCGQKFESWEEVVSVYADEPWTCPHCGAKLFFSVNVKVYKV
jgi:DNA-directed RNA polymerase subunit RPC12/RpoP